MAELVLQPDLPDRFLRVLAAQEDGGFRIFHFGREVHPGQAYVGAGGRIEGESSLQFGISLLDGADETMEAVLEVEMNGLDGATLRYFGDEKLRLHWVFPRKGTHIILHLQVLLLVVSL